MILGYKGILMGLKRIATIGAMGLLGTSMLSGCDDETTISHKDKAIKVQRTLSPEELIAKTEKAYYFDGLDAFKDQIRTRTDVEADVKKKMLRILNRRKNTTHIVENMSDLKHSPLQETGVPRDFGALLGYVSDADSIIAKYNEEIASTLKGKSVAHIGYEKYDSLVVPLVYPSMDSFFMPSLEDFLAAHPELAEDIGTDSTVMIVTEVSEGKFGLGYYADGHLAAACPVSVGMDKMGNYYTGEKGNRKKHTKHLCTTPGVYHIQNHIRRHRSTGAHEDPESKKSAMMYLMWFNEADGKGFHRQKVFGGFNSSGCVRVPGEHEQYLYKNVKNGTKVVVHGTHRGKKE